MTHKGYNIVFLTYLSRSGSTFLSNILNAHPEILVTIEADFPFSLFGIINPDKMIDNEGQLKQYLKYIEQDSKFRSWSIPSNAIEQKFLVEYSFPSKLTSLFYVILDLYRESRGAVEKIIIFKGRVNVSHFEKLGKSFPNARMLSIIRDPRAIFNSQKKSLNINHNVPLGYNPFDFSLRWKTEVATAIELHKQANDFYIVKYEDLIKITNSTINEILKWLGVRAINYEMLGSGTYGRTIPNNQIHLHKNINKKPDLSRIESWRDSLTENEIFIIETICKDRLLKLNYPIHLENYSINASMELYLKTKYYTISKIVHTKVFIKRLIKMLCFPQKIILDLKIRFWKLI